MSRLFYHTMQDNLGNLLFGVTGTVRLAGTGTVATIYGDEAMTVPIANPMTNHPSFASFKCFLAAGAYDFYMAKSGYTFETLTGLQGTGTMAQQNASAVLITGGAGAFTTGLSANGANTNLDNTTLQVDVAVHRVNINPAGGTEPGLDCVPRAYFRTSVGVQVSPQLNTGLAVKHARASQYGLSVGASDGDTGGNAAIQFLNVANGGIGSITTTATTTAYNTTSDGRLKKEVATLTGELDVLRALRPVAFKWVADDSPGVGFLAHEVAAHVQGVITGEEGAVDDEGAIKPQMIDYSKLVPYLVGAMKTLTARLAVLEDALGV